MRELKFRVWDEMLKSYSTDLRCNVMEFFDSPDGMVQYGCVDIAKAFANQLDGQVIEQFTGLRDKNEREIYEGDIVRVYVNQLRSREIITIEWRKDGYHLPSWRPLALGAYDDLTYEVIGNIHENPDLLD